MRSDGFKHARVVGFVALVLLETALIVYSARLVGLAIERAIVHDWAGFWLEDFPLWLGLFAGAALLRWKKLHRVLPLHPVWVAGGCAAFLTAGMLYVGYQLSRNMVDLPDLGIWVFHPAEASRVCTRGPRCWSYTTDEHGLRNGPGDSPPAGAPVLAVLGDSFVFGVGVNDAETLPAQLQRSLAAVRPDLRVINAGLPGLSLASYPAMARYGISRYGADWLLVLMNCSDVVLRDVNTRLSLVRHNVLWRLLAVLNIEMVIEYGWLFSRPDRPDPEAAQALVERLEALVAATQGRPLLLVTDWLPAYTEVLASWFEGHPEVGWFNVGGSPTWRQAETLPNDAHWSPGGVAVIVQQLRETVLALLQQRPSEGTSRPPGASLRLGIRVGPGPALELGFLASPTLTVRQQPGDPSVQTLTFDLGDLGFVEFEAAWCVQNGGAFRVGDVCFVYTVPVSELQRSAVRRILAEHEREIGALRFPAP